MACFSFITSSATDTKGDTYSLDEDAGSFGASQADSVVFHATVPTATTFSTSDYILVTYSMQPNHAVANASTTSSTTVGGRWPATGSPSTRSMVTVMLSCRNAAASPSSSAGTCACS